MSELTTRHWKTDLTAALTVTLVGIPQCLAYAMMSGLPPAYGLATAALPGFVAALVGQSPHIVTGPTNTTGLLILAAMGPYLGQDGFVTEAGLSALATLVLLAGLIRLIAARIGGAALIRFLPESVLAGFTAGAGILILVMQTDEAFGFRPIADSGVFGEFGGIAAQIRDGVRPAWPTMLLTAATAASIWYGKKYIPRVPMALFAVVGAAALAWLTGLDATSGLSLVSDRSVVPNAWPRGALPSFDPTLIGSFLIPAAAIALLGTLELAVSARADGARPDMAREITAQGLANVAGAFASSFPASASLTRSALLRLGNAQTRLAPMFAAVFTVPILLFGGTFVGYIPQASLAGVLLAVAIRMINVPRLKQMWGGHRTIRLLLASTLLATLLLPLEWAVLVGASLGLVIHLRRTATPRIDVYRPTSEGLTPWTPEELAPTRVLQVSGALYYAAVDPVIEAIAPHAERADTLIIDVSHAHELRYAALQAFDRTRTAMEARGARLFVVGVDEGFASLAARTGSPLTLSPRHEVPGRAVRLILDQLDHSPAAEPIFRQLFDRDTCTYTYLLGCPRTAEAVLIDPVADHAARDVSLVEGLGLSLRYTIDTHLHGDHITGAARLREETGCQSVASAGSSVQGADLLVDHGDHVEFGEYALDVRATPGHTTGCMTLVLRNSDMAFTGDTLLIRGCGRTDYADGDSRRLYRSVHEQIFTLPDQTRLFPAHDYQGRTVTTVGEEKAHNPRLGGGRSVEQFVEIMAQLDLPRPRHMAVAVPANLDNGVRATDGDVDWPIVTRHDGVPELEPWWVDRHPELRLVDVRRVTEFVGRPAPVDRVENVPLAELEAEAAGWNRQEPLVVVCQKGVRSAAAAQTLLSLGFGRVASVRGGWDAWPPEAPR